MPGKLYLPIAFFQLFKNMKFLNFYYFSQCFCRKKFKGYMLICRNAYGVHGQRKVGNPWTK